MSVTLVGSRKAPSNVLNLAYEIGQSLDEPMFSGAAHGMDSIWENAYINAGRKDLINIILPKDNFNGRVVDNVNYYLITDYDHSLLEEADRLIMKLHPNYNSLNGFSYWAHIRNCFQVLGHDLQSPSCECYLYAPILGNTVTGGTATAFNLCKLFNIPTYNIADSCDLAYLKSRFNIKYNNLDFLWNK